MIWQLRQEVAYRPRWYLNGFPKAGLHLLEMMISPLASPLPGDGLRAGQWLGTFPFNSWIVSQHKNRELFTRQIARLQPGYYLKGHAGHFEVIDTFMEYSGVAHIFIYRDLRDAVVSQAHHIMSGDDSRFKHPAKMAYAALGGFDEILLACINGLGAFSGIVERWVAYTDWLDSEWTLSIKYEDLKAEPEKLSRQILEYGIERMLSPYRKKHRFIIDAGMFDSAVAEMVNLAARSELSPTFRAGKSGTWRETFKPVHSDAFFSTGGVEWCRKLGYEV